MSCRYYSISFIFVRFFELCITVRSIYCLGVGNFLVKIPFASRRRAAETPQQYIELPRLLKFSECQTNSHCKFRTCFSEDIFEEGWGFDFLESISVGNFHLEVFFSFFVEAFDE